MAQVAVTVTPYPGSTEGIEFEEYAAYGVGWTTAASVAGPGDSYLVTVTSAGHKLRARWEITTGVYTDWFSLSGVETRTPTDEQASQLKDALIYKTARLFLETGASFGYTGEMTELGMATVRPDYAIREMLHGLRFVNWDVDYSTLVSVDDVIRKGFQQDPADWTTEKKALVTESLEGAASWVANEIFQGLAFA